MSVTDASQQAAGPSAAVLRVHVTEVLSGPDGLCPESEAERCWLTSNITLHFSPHLEFRGLPAAPLALLCGIQGPCARVHNHLSWTCVPSDHRTGGLKQPTVLSLISEHQKSETRTTWPGLRCGQGQAPSSGWKLNSLPPPALVHAAFLACARIAAVSALGHVTSSSSRDTCHGI